MKKNGVIRLETTAEHDVNELIKERVSKAVQEEVDKCSKEYFRTIKIGLDIVTE